MPSSSTPARAAPPRGVAVLSVAPPGQVTSCSTITQLKQQQPRCRVAPWLPCFVGDQKSSRSSLPCWSRPSSAASCRPCLCVPPPPCLLWCRVVSAELSRPRCAIWPRPWLESLPPAQHAARTGCGAGCRKNGVNRRSQSDPPELGASRMPALASPSQVLHFKPRLRRERSAHEQRGGAIRHGF